MGYEQIKAAYLRGDITREEATNLLTRFWSAGIDDVSPTAQMNRERQQADWSRTWSSSAGSTTATTTQPMGPVTQLEGHYLSEDPTAAWNRAYNLPSVGANPFQAWLRGQSGPAYSAYAGKNVADIMAGLPGTSFGSYLGPADLGAMPQRALGTLRDVRGRQEPAQEDWMRQVQDVGGNLRQLFEAALQGRGYAGPFARAASRNVPGYQEQWNTQTLGGSRQQDTGTLLAYLMRQMGL